MGTDTVQQRQTDFVATVTKVKASGADAVFFGGYYPEAGLLAKQLRAGGWDGTFVSGDGVLDPGFVEGAGASPRTAPSSPAPARRPTTSLRREVQGAQRRSEPGHLLGRGLRRDEHLPPGGPDGNTDREAMLEWVNGYDAKGITKQIKFDEKGELAEVTVYAYKVEGGKIVPGTPIT